MKKNEVPANLAETFGKMDFQITPVGVTDAIKFADFAVLYNYVTKEHTFWNEQQHKAAQQIKSHWRVVLREADSLLQSAPSENFIQYLRQLASRLQNQIWPNVISESLFAQRVLNLPANISELRFEAFLTVAIPGYSARLNLKVDTPEVLSGLMEGLAFREPGIFGDFHSHADSELRKNFEERQKETAQLRGVFSTFEKSLQDAFEKNKESIDQWRNEKISALDTDLKVIRQRYADLEQLYSEKLKLEAPAQYWHKRASRMRCVGLGWLAASIACVLAGGWLLWNYFVAPGVFVDPKDFVNQTALGAVKEPTAAFFASAKNIRALIGFSVIVSLSFFLLRMLIRLTVSAFHLSIDAAEREQLTYLYLSLMDKSQKDGKDIIVGEDRKIILQSLFSRADTGLLAGDSSPTMPGVETITALRSGGK